MGSAEGESYDRRVQFRPMIYLAVAINAVDWGRPGYLESVTCSN